MLSALVPVAIPMARRCAGDIQMCQQDRSSTDSCSILAREESDRSIWRAIASSQESIASPSTGLTRTGNRVSCTRRPARAESMRVLAAQGRSTQESARHLGSHMHCREIRPTSSAGILQRGSKSGPFYGRCRRTTSQFHWGLSSIRVRSGLVATQLEAANVARSRPRLPPCARALQAAIPS